MKHVVWARIRACVYETYIMIRIIIYATRIGWTMKQKENEKRENRSHKTVTFYHPISTTFGVFVSLTEVYIVTPTKLVSQFSMVFSRSTSGKMHIFPFESHYDSDNIVMRSACQCSNITLNPQCKIRIIGFLSSEWTGSEPFDHSCRTGTNHGHDRRLRPYDFIKRMSMCFMIHRVESSANQCHGRVISFADTIQCTQL